MVYDLFISYCRRDNLNGRVTELKKQIEDDYRESTHEELRCFFDKNDIHGMEDWRNRILGGLRESNLLLLVLSPGYLESEYCQWEVVEFLKYEHSRALQGEGVAAVYFVEIPGLNGIDFKKRAAWMERVRMRNHVDLRPWHDEGAAALRRANLGEYAAAEPLYRRALEARERVLGSAHPNVRTFRDNLAGLREKLA